MIPRITDSSNNRIERLRGSSVGNGARRLGNDCRRESCGDVLAVLTERNARDCFLHENFPSLAASNTSNVAADGEGVTLSPDAAGGAA